jgi:predicted nucleic acid-binding Zn ribbon protein
MKCPRCHKEVSESNKFCPHCGYSLKKQTFNNKTLYMMFIFSFIIVPLLYTIILSGDSYNYNTLTTTDSSNKIVLNDIINMEATATSYHFTSLDEFKYQVSQSDAYVSKVKAYETTLKNKYDLSFTKTYDIYIYNNNDVEFNIVYSYDLDNNTTFCINEIFTRSGSEEETYTFTQNQITNLQDIKLKEYTDVYLKDVNVDSLYTDLLARETEFNKKIDNIGHMGFGEYEDNASLVVYPDNSLFKVVLKYKG